MPLCRYCSIRSSHDVTDVLHGHNLIQLGIIWAAEPADWAQFGRLYLVSSTYFIANVKNGLRFRGDLAESHRLQRRAEVHLPGSGSSELSATSPNGRPLPPACFQELALIERLPIAARWRFETTFLRSNRYVDFPESVEITGGLG